MPRPRQRLIAAVMALVLSVGVLPAAAQQRAATGSLAGRATNEARRPYTNYIVQLRDAENAQIIGTVPLDASGRFQFTTLDLSRRFLVELYNVQARQLVCTEGPYVLTASTSERNDVNIDCGAAPAALWLLAATTGAVGAIALTTVSQSE